MLNVAVLTGRLTVDPEFKTTQSGVSVCSFTIAVRRSYQTTAEPVTDFIDVVAWRQKAEFVSKHFKKGDVIGVVGSIETRKYTDKNGNNRTAFEVVAKEMQFVESKKKEEKPYSQTEDAYNDLDISGDDLPF